ncbi:AMP-binding protein [Streptomyces sp. NPDC051956]|uniref:AMP-binding protein n=1 Tax=Streptomyces sp. NPDC051956 TaxID=3365677 RepID=UPI0037CF9A4E
MDSVRRTYEQTRSAAATMAGALAARGVRPGDRVAALMSNRVELVDLVLGCAWLGAVVVPLNTALHGRLLRHALSVAQPQCLYAEGELAGRVAEVGYTGRVWTVGARDAPVPFAAAEADAFPSLPGDAAAILFTSGTTGPSRGVRCPQAQFVWWGRNVSDALRLGAEDTLYTCLPLFHTNALNCLAQAMAVGATVVVDGRFSASRYWARVAAADATCVYLLGAMVPMLLAQAAGPGDRAHRAWGGGGGPPPRGGGGGGGGRGGGGGGGGGGGAGGPPGGGGGGAPPPPPAGGVVGAVPGAVRGRARGRVRLDRDQSRHRAHPR